jgi:hypothetical protein
MSDTPETDKEAISFAILKMHLPSDDYEICSADFTRKLERELAEAREQIQANQKVVAIMERMIYEAREKGMINQPMLQVNES